MRASGSRPHESGTLRGFFNLTLPSGIVLNGSTLFEKGDSRWIGFPGAPQIEAGRHRIDPATGKPAWTPVMEIPDRDTRDRFTALALAAVDRVRRQ
jgi:hypothetical protein